MAKRVEKRERRSVVLEPDPAGIDIGAHEIYVAVPPDRDQETTRRFSSFTYDLHALADWLESCRVRTVVMEIDQRVLDTAVSDIRRARLHGLSCQCAFAEDRAGPQERCL